MTTNEVKPGTPCECRDVDCAAPHGDFTRTRGWRGCPDQCGDAAVRLVRVRHVGFRDGGMKIDRGVVTLPMCDACAEYHERDKAERDETGIHCDCGKPKFSSAVACDSCLGTASAIHGIHGMPGEPEPTTANDGDEQDNICRECGDHRPCDCEPEPEVES